MNTPGPGVDTHEMVLIHRVIRREFGQLPHPFRSAANDRARSKIIGAHAREMGWSSSATSPRKPTTRNGRSSCK